MHNHGSLILIMFLLMLLMLDSSASSIDELFNVHYSVMNKWGWANCGKFRKTDSYSKLTRLIFLFTIKSSYLYLNFAPIQSYVKQTFIHQKKKLSGLAELEFRALEKSRCIIQHFVHSYCRYAR